MTCTGVSLDKNLGSGLGLAIFDWWRGMASDMSPPCWNTFKAISKT